MHFARIIEAFSCPSSIQRQSLNLQSIDVLHFPPSLYNISSSSSSSSISLASLVFHHLETSCIFQRPTIREPRFNSPVASLSSLHSTTHLLYLLHLHVHIDAPRPAHFFDQSVSPGLPCHESTPITTDNRSSCLFKFAAVRCCGCFLEYLVTFNGAAIIFMMAGWPLDVCRHILEHIGGHGGNTTNASAAISNFAAQQEVTWDIIEDTIPRLRGDECTTRHKTYRF